MSVRPRIAVTMGDPAGIGPEICLKALADPLVAACCTPVLYGDAGILEGVAAACALSPWGGAVVDCRALQASAVRPGTVDAACGRAAYAYIEKAIEAALDGEIAAVVTAPINKESLNLAGVPFPGHTEIFASKSGSDRACMMQTSDELTVSFVTTHVSYDEVARLVTRERILAVVELTAEAMTRIRGTKPTIVVCGLNPHAGEHGLFGGEEAGSIVPAVEAAKAKGLDVCGPIPPDTAFLPARRASTDAFVCMYHDQGHIPLKMLAFDRAVNITLGLPIIRTSVDHGTAFDIAWQGKANPGSLVQAILLAARLARQ